jgi:bacterial/archaeal transporter family-2 protein
LTAPATDAAPSPRPLHLLAALASGGLLSLMVLCNAEVTRHGGPLLGSLVPHLTGTLAAGLALALLARRGTGTGAPAWAYLGGLSGAVTVMLSSVAANTALALSGTLALGLVGQAAFGLVADRWGLLGLPRRRPTLRDLAALGLILGGSAILIFGAPA